jgi:hypothetical protein
MKDSHNHQSRNKPYHKTKFHQNHHHAKKRTNNKNYENSKHQFHHDKSHQNGNNVRISSFNSKPNEKVGLNICLHVSPELGKKFG